MTPTSRAAVQATEPIMSRRHAAGAESARGLLFTVLGEFVLPGGGFGWTSAFIEVLGRLGVEEKASRQALMRTGSDGWLTSERVGRRTRWRLTSNAEHLLTEGTERIYSFTGSMQDWDRRWLLVLARVPETERPARHLLRTRLGWAGFGNPSPGIWISGYTDRIGEVEQVLKSAGVFDDAQIFVAEHQGSGDLANLVRLAWDLDAIEESYEEFITDFSNASTSDPLTRLIELVHSWRRFPWIDPGLPREFLPSRWSGVEAAKLFARRHAKWSADATAEWQRINSEGA
jgi:phenylacetic acid degradation operon negative regulatory protein